MANRRGGPRIDYAAAFHKLRVARGGRCEHCGKRLRYSRRGHPNLHFAHLAWTGLYGRGRGRAERYHDIKRNPSSYAMICRQCHLKMDMMKPIELPADVVPF